MLTKAKVLQLLFMLTVLLVLFFWRTFEDNTLNQAVEERELAVFDSIAAMPSKNGVRCDYQEACEFINEQGTFSLNIKELPIKAEEWIHFELSVAHENSQISSAQIVGKSMFMGKVPVSFKQSDSYQFTGSAIVAACTHDEMVWTLEIEVNDGAEQQQLMFDFLVKK